MVARLTEHDRPQQVVLDEDPEFLRPLGRGPRGPSAARWARSGDEPAHRPIAWVVVLALVAGTIGLCLFQPWLLFTRAGGDGATRGTEAAAPARRDQGGGATLPANATPIAAGTILTNFRPTSGTVKIARLPDGRVQLALVDFATVEGPDLRVWLTDQPRSEGLGQAGWQVFDDGRYVDLGALKAITGNQVYDVPPGTDLKGLISFTIWSKGALTSYGAAQLSSLT